LYSPIEALKQPEANLATARLEIHVLLCLM